MAMLDDESVPTFFANANLSSSSSITSLFSDCELNYSNNIKIKRRKSLSLDNISLTSSATFETCYSNTRSKSHYNVKQICKPKLNKYAHVQSKVRKYIIEANKEQEEGKKRRLLAEQKIREELRSFWQLEDSKIKDNLRMFEALEHQKILEELPKFEPNLIQIEGDFNRNFEPFPEEPIVEQLEQIYEQYTPDFLYDKNQKKSGELPKFDEPNVIKIEGDYLRNFEPFPEDPIVEQLAQVSEQYTTDFQYDRNQNILEELSKFDDPNVIKIEEDYLRNFEPFPEEEREIRSRRIVNTLRLSIFEGNSTCRTIDVQDLRLNESITETKDDFVSKNNKFEPFYVKSISPTSNGQFLDLKKPQNTEQKHGVRKFAIISNNGQFLDLKKPQTTEQKHGIRKFIDGFLKCPKFMKRKSWSGGALFKNKIYPDYKIPQVVIVSPLAMDLDNTDNGNARFTIFQK